MKYAPDVPVWVCKYCKQGVLPAGKSLSNDPEVEWTIAGRRHDLVCERAPRTEHLPEAWGTLAPGVHVGRVNRAPARS